MAAAHRFKIAAFFASMASSLALAQDEGEVVLRVASFHIGDVRTADLKRDDATHLRQLAEVLQRLRPNVVLLSGIAYDAAGAPGMNEGDTPGQNGRRFVDHYLSRPQAADLQPLRLKAFMAPTNSGMASGFDLDRNGRVVTTFSAAAAGDAPSEYSGDCWAPGEYPGHRGMTLLIDERLTFEPQKVRTFRVFPWNYMTAPHLPGADSGSSFFKEEELRVYRLSSVSHWDVPVTLSNGAVIHFLCSNPVLPDSRGGLRAHRNLDEIRFWADYVARREYFVDDRNVPGPLELEGSFVILGTLNADPKDGPNLGDPVGTILFGTHRINAEITPTSEIPIETLEPSDTARSGLRLDYVLPSSDLGIAAAGVWRTPPADQPTFPSPHFPVWMELVVPRPALPPPVLP